VALTLSALYRYPVKSCHGDALTQAAVSPFGLPFDRHWMLATAAGRMVTGRDLPRIVLLHAAPDDTGVTLTAPGMPPLRVETTSLAECAPASVWRDDFPALTGNAEADAWVSEFLGEPLRLFYIGATSARRVRNRPDNPLTFADGFPLLLATTESLDTLSGWVGRPMDMARFRPNLVVSGAEAFAEDHWQRLRIGDVEFALVKPCERCVFTTVDPHSGEKSLDQEPLRALGKHRKTEAGVLFGVNVIAEGSGEISVGMPVEVIA